MPKQSTQKKLTDFEQQIAFDFAENYTTASLELMIEFDRVKWERIILHAIEIKDAGSDNGIDESEIDEYSITHAGDQD